jgi:hypothetical protein
MENHYTTARSITAVIDQINKRKYGLESDDDDDDDDDDDKIGTKAVFCHQKLILAFFATVSAFLIITIIVLIIKISF